MANPNTAKFPGAIVTDLDLPPATNSFSTTLTDDIDDTVTIIPVTNVDLNFPTIIKIDSEFILVGDKSGFNLIDCVRGFDGSTEAAHFNGAIVNVFVMAHHFNQICAEMVALQTFAGIDGVNLLGATGSSGSIGESGPSGSSLPLPALIYYKAGISQNGVTVLGFSTEVATTPSPINIVGTNTILGAAAFATGKYVQDHFRIPTDFDGTSITVTVHWNAVAIIGDCAWEIYFSPISDGDNIDTAFSSPESLLDVVNGTTNRLSVKTDTFTITGIAAGDELFFKFGRTASDDTLSGNANLIGLCFSLPRA
jgi:hypothetical protein